jgi:L-amino acid N-acyltransferase YncA
MDLVIRQANVDDAEGVARILNQAISARTYTVFDRPFTVDEERAFIASFPPRGIFHVAVTADERIVGFQNMEPFGPYTGAFAHVGVLGSYVDLDLRRQGIARRLFQATYQAAVRKAYEKIFTFVRADNEAAIRTYLSQGFHIIATARRQAKIDGRYIDEVLIERFLEGTTHTAARNPQTLRR